MSALQPVPPLVLASRSPRRRQLLSILGLPYDVAAADIDETRLPGEAPVDYVQRVAREKTEAIAARLGTDVLVIAADTTVADGDDILGKPADAAEARSMLRQLRNRAHTGYTAIALRLGDQLVEDLAETAVWMRNYTDDEIEAYIASGDPFDKAGGYAIQNGSFQPASVTACYANVMGLPLCHLSRGLRRLGIAVRADVPAGCRGATDYPCQIYPTILGASDTSA